MSTVPDIKYRDFNRLRLYQESNESHHRYIAAKRLSSTQAYIRDLKHVRHQANKRLLKYEQHMGYR